MNVSVTLIAAAIDVVALVRVAGGLHFIMRDGMPTLRAAAAARELCTVEEREAVRAMFSAPALAVEPTAEGTWSHVPSAVSRDWLPA